MNITEMTGLPTMEVKKPTGAELQSEYNYIFAQELTKKLLDKGLITEDEFKKISDKNLKTFFPFISRLMS